MLHHHSNHSDHDHADHMMSMFFHAGYTEVILFNFWRTLCLGEFLGSIVGLFILAILYEGLKLYRETLLQRAYYRQGVFESISTVGHPVDANNDGSPMHIQRTVIGGGATPYKVMFKLKPLSIAHMVQTVLHVLQLLISYLLMLVVMTYNVWLLLAVVLGSGVGYFLFGWRRTSVMDACEHCH